MLLGCVTHIPKKEHFSWARSTSWCLGFLRILSSLICQIWTFLSRFYLSPQWGPSDWWLLLLIFLTEENGCSPLCDSLKVLRGTVTHPLPYLQSSPGPATVAQERWWADRVGALTDPPSAPSSPGPATAAQEWWWAGKTGAFGLHDWSGLWSGSQRRFLKDLPIILHTFFFCHQELVQETSLASPTYIEMLLSYTSWGHPCSS